MDALATVQRLLEPAGAPAPLRTAVLRDPRPGDLGWVVQQHGEIYAREYGWTSEFEALVAGIAAEFIQNFDPAWEKGWIAELDGERVGAVFVVRKSATVAQLRLLILTPQARGLGLGARLVDECIAFARSKGYKKMVLWTNSCLDAARDRLPRAADRRALAEFVLTTMEGAVMQARTHRDIGCFDRSVGELRHYFALLEARPAPRAQKSTASRSPTRKGART